MSLMPRSVYQRLGCGDLIPTRIALQLADRSIRYPDGVLLDVPIQVGELWVPGDFVVIDREEDEEIPIILGRPSLASAFKQSKVCAAKNSVFPVVNKIEGEIPDF